MKKEETQWICPQERVEPDTLVEGLALERSKATSLIVTVGTEDGQMWPYLGVCEIFLGTFWLFS